MAKDVYSKTGINWHEAFTSESFRLAKGNRVHFVVPLLALFTAAFLGLFTLQSFGQSIAQTAVFGYVDVGFLTVMTLFPTTIVLGLLFTRYTERHVYPYEDAVIREFGSAAEVSRLAERESEEMVVSAPLTARGVGA